MPVANGPGILCTFFLPKKERTSLPLASKVNGNFSKVFHSRKGFFRGGNAVLHFLRKKKIKPP